MHNYFLTIDETKIAPCTTTDPEIFFGYGKTYPYLSEAKAVCATCPFTSRCVKYAHENDLIGIWGGTTDEQRKALFRTHIAIEGRDV
jgi:WhiB family redox-sensing transcriptional regulator